MTISVERCRNIMSKARLTDSAHEKTVCTENPKGRGTCKGDSGGPLISKENELVGIVSKGIPCALAVPDIYMNVYLYGEWIDGVIQK